MGATAQADGDWENGPFVVTCDSNKDGPGKYCFGEVNPFEFAFCPLNSQNKCPTFTECHQQFVSNKRYGAKKVSQRAKEKKKWKKPKCEFNLDIPAEKIEYKAQGIGVICNDTKLSLRSIQKTYFAKLKIGTKKLPDDLLKQYSVDEFYASLYYLKNPQRQKPPYSETLKALEELGFTAESIGNKKVKFELTKKDFFNDEQVRFHHHYGWQIEWATEGYDFFSVNQLCENRGNPDQYFHNDPPGFGVTTVYLPQCKKPITVGKSRQFHSERKVIYENLILCENINKNELCPSANECANRENINISDPSIPDINDRKGTWNVYEYKEGSAFGQ